MGTVKQYVTSGRPQTGEFASYHEQYINLVPGNNIIEVLEDQILSMQSFISEVPEEKEEYKYAEGKWTIKEVIGHINDTERIMAYRALCIARGDTTAFPSFDENSYIKHSNFNRQSLYDLAHDFSLIRASNLSLFKSFDETAYKRIGIASKYNISTRALLHIIAGHYIHHVNVVKSRYL